MNTTSGVLRLALAMSVGAAVGWAGMHQINKKQEKYEKEYNEASREVRLSAKSRELERQVEAFGLPDNGFNQSYYIQKVTEWAEQIEKSPKSKERDAFAAAIVKTTHDDEITEVEYKALRKQNNELHQFNINAATKNNAENIRDGKPIGSNLTEQDKNYLSRLYKTELAMNWIRMQEQQSADEYERWKADYDAKWNNK